LRDALKPLLGKINIATMREANLRAGTNDGASSSVSVAQWLWDKISKE
jgi:osmoprotectant transport system permease protein